MLGAGFAIVISLTTKEKKQERHKNGTKTESLIWLSRDLYNLEIISHGKLVETNYQAI